MTKTVEWQKRFWELANEREELMEKLEKKQAAKEELDRSVEIKSREFRKEIVELKAQLGPIDMERASLARLLDGKTGPDPRHGLRKAG